MKDRHAEILVLGGGPGGYTAAFRAADLGAKTVLADSRAELGGVCLNEGCIPSKTLLHAAKVIREAEELRAWGINHNPPEIAPDVLRARKNGIVKSLNDGLAALAKKRNVSLVRGLGKFTGANSMTLDGEGWSFDKAIIAVGSKPAGLPNFPEDKRIWDSTAALDMDKVPERLAIIGGGIIGLEMATVYSALGSEVTIIDIAERIIPDADPEAVDILKTTIEKTGVKIYTSTAINKVDTTAQKIILHSDNKNMELQKVDAVLLAVGRKSNAGDISVRSAGVNINDDGIIPVDSSCRTNIGHIFAIGDVTGNPMLAHKAIHQGKVAAESASGLAAHMATTLIPSVAYTNPELAWVGVMPENAEKNSCKVSNFPWSASGRNLCSGGGGGLTRIVSDKKTGRILGAVIVGQNAGELIAECCHAIEMGSTLEDIALTIHAHPTLSETIALASENGLGTITDL